MRDLFHVDDGFWYVGTDAAALENRTLSSYTYKYDDGAFARMQTEGDPHSFNAFAFFPELHDKFDINNQENKENHEFKSWRNKAKTGAYLLAFGGGAPKLASSLGLSQADGKKAFDNYWESNKGLGLLKKATEKYFDTTGKKKHIPAIDGRIVSVRGKNVLLSCLGQGCGAIAMSYAACVMDNKLGDMFIDSRGRPYYLYNDHIVKRVSMMHDEYSWEVEDGIENEVKEISVKAIIKAGELLKLALPLNGEGKISYEGSWRDVH
jgi:DNA polymerase I-like protein with 3'-5' exonuclease and polymerase domains